MAMQFQFEQTQWLSPEQILERQIPQLGVLLAHAYATTPFYRARLDAAGLPPDAITGPDAWRQIPLLTRGDIQAAGDTLQSTAVPDEHGPRSRMLTSGSTGRPVMTIGTGVTQLYWNACTLRDHVWHRRIAGAKLAAIRSLSAEVGLPPDGITADDWGPATNGIMDTGPSVMLNIHSTIAEQAEWLLRQDPDYLLTYPSNVAALIRHIGPREGRLARLREVRTFGELVEPRVREECLEIWGLNIVDIYSSQEVGYLALQCPDYIQYHVQSENVLVEVLDDANQPCEPGQIGRLVVTSLHNFALPLLRYEIGDYAEVGWPCPCGRGLPVLRRILGRQRNMAILPNGERRWPSIELSGTDAMDEFPPIQQFQLVQRTLEQMEMLLVTPRPLTPAEVDLLHGWVTRAVGHRFELKLTYVADIPRSASGKFEDFRCEIDPSRLSAI
jgi:phenylacetate-CoA ligase